MGSRGASEIESLRAVENKSPSDDTKGKMENRGDRKFKKFKNIEEKFGSIGILIAFLGRPCGPEFI